MVLPKPARAACVAIAAEVGTAAFKAFVSFESLSVVFEPLSSLLADSSCFVDGVDTVIPFAFFD